MSLICNDIPNGSLSPVPYKSQAVTSAGNSSRGTWVQCKTYVIAHFRNKPTALIRCSSQVP